MVEKEFASIKKYISLKKYKKAEIICSRAFKKFPDHSEFHYLMGLIYYAEKRFKNSLKHIKNFLLKNPENKDGLVSKIYNEMALEKNEEALKTLFTLKKNFNNNADIFTLIAKNYEVLNKFKKAELYYKNALKVSSTKNNIFNLHNFYLSKHSFKKSLEILLNCNLLNSDSEINYKVSQVYFQLKDFKSSLKYLLKAELMDKKNAEIKKEIGFIYSILGDEEKSIKFYKYAIDLKPDYGFVHFQLSRIDNKIEESELNKLITSYHQIKDTKKDYIFLGFAIANYLDEQKKFPKSFEYLKKSNDLVRKDLIKNEKWKFEYEKKIFENIKDIYDENIINDSRSEQTPIFILGLPRSGTTLIEQIISNHSCVFGGGEVSFLQRELFKIFGNLEKEIIKPNISIETLKKIQSSYIKKFNTPKKFFTDKAPINFLYIGFIRTIFPNAKIILCMRNKMDNLLSMFQTVFAEKNYKFSYNISELKEYYNLYSNLIKFWKEKRISFYELKYENLILNTELQIEKILNFLGLEKENNCITFYKNKRPVQTASFNQVRKPIYKSSIEKWKNYSEFLEN